MNTTSAGAPAVLRRAPRQLWLGLSLVAVCWPLNWLWPGLRTHLLFFPLWLGYCLAVDGLVWLRQGTSLLARNGRAYLGLFLVSTPLWWLFEALNWRTANWEYTGREHFSPLAYALLASLNFSTVLPAVFGTAELLATAGWLRRLPPGPRLRPQPPVLAAMFGGGLLGLAALLLWPRTFFPLMWLSLYFILAPLNAWLGHRALLRHTAVGDWQPVLALALGALVCGFFWEFWNYFSYPGWVYHVPPFEFLYIFEMPLLGYGGYLPFGLELFAMYHLIVGLLGRRYLWEYVRLSPPAAADPGS